MSWALRENKAADLNAIQRLPMELFKARGKYDSTGKYDEQCRCMICLENFKDGDRIRRLPCGHIFHLDEIDKWLGLNNVCPLCRATVIK